MNKRDPKLLKSKQPRRASRFVGFPNLNHLYYFHVVAMEGSLKQTCEILGVTQPTISAQIKSLEEFVGVRLFRREVGGMRLSAAGRRMFEHTSVMFRATEVMLRGFAQESERSAPALEMAIATTVTNILPARHLLPIMGPDVFLRLRHGDHQPLLIDLLAGEIDVLLTDIGPGDGDSPKLASQIVDRPKLIGVYSSSHEVTDAFPMCLEEIELFHYSVGCQYRWDIDQYLHDHGIEPDVMAESDDATIMLDAAERGRCIAIVPESVAEEAIAAGRVQVLGDVDGVQTEVYARYLKKPRQTILSAIEALRGATGIDDSSAGKPRIGPRRRVRSTEGFTFAMTLPPEDR